MGPAIVVIICFILLSALLPDFYIPQILNYLKEKIGSQNEDEKLFYIPQILGWVERSLYYLFLVIFVEQFVVFLGVWLALKTVITYSPWENSDDSKEKYSGHKSRGKFLIFLIGNGLSIISAILLFLMSKYIISI